MCPTHTRSDKHTNSANSRTAANNTTATANKGRAAVQLGWQTGIQTATAHSTMAFKNEVVSDADIDRYKLPFPKGEGRWWTRDAERDYYLWGGLVGNLAYEETQEGWFYLFVHGKIYDICIEPSQPKKDDKAQETVFHWKNITSINPEPSGANREIVIGILKEALKCFGFDGRKSIYHPRYRVSFGF